MPGTDLDVVIRSIAKRHIKVLTAAARKRHRRLMGMAAKAKDKQARQRHKHIAKATLISAAAAARRLHITAENAADAYARAIKKAADEVPATKPAKKKPRRTDANTQLAPAAASLQQKKPRTSPRLFTES